MSGVDATAAPGPLPRWLAPVGWIGAPIYAAAVARRNRRFDTVVPKRLPLPVISVGNLSAGGTGKTPTVAWIIETLRGAGHRPLIAMRGYKATPGAKSDEQLEHEERYPDVPVIAHPDRHAAVSRFLAEHGGGDHDAIVLDDGFQHRVLHRDLDLVLIDAMRPPDRDALLPLGFLREPVESLRRAHGVLLTRIDHASDEAVATLRGNVSRWHGRAPLAEFTAEWAALDSDAWADPQPPAWLRGRRIAVACAIGHPAAFLSMVERHRATVVERLIERDHASFNPILLQRFVAHARSAGAAAVLVTAKDWVKMRTLPAARQMAIPFVRARLELIPTRGGEELRRAVLETVKGARGSGSASPSAVSTPAC